MGNPSFSLRFAVFLSFSVAASSSSQFFFQKSGSPFSSTPPIPKATPSDLLSVLGPSKQSSKINPLVSRELKSCFKFLVPFSPSNTKPQNQHSYSNRKLASENIIQFRNQGEENELIWWPPEPVLELARLAFDSGGDPDVIHRALDPSVLPIPDVEGSKENRCELTRTPYGRRFISQELNSYLKFLFEVIAARGPSIGLNVSLNRYDFFHGHLFIATKTGRDLAYCFMLKNTQHMTKKYFHAIWDIVKKIYANSNAVLPLIGSTVTYDDSMNFRNILWLAPFPSNSSKAWVAPGVLVVLDAHPGGIIYRDIIPEYVNFARTIYEDDFGDVVVDVNYLNVGGIDPSYEIFIC